jgi:hypothetical protein
LKQKLELEVEREKIEEIFLPERRERDKKSESGSTYVCMYECTYTYIYVLGMDPFSFVTPPSLLFLLHYHTSESFAEKGRECWSPNPNHRTKGLPSGNEPYTQI